MGYYVQRICMRGSYGGIRVLWAYGGIRVSRGKQSAAEQII